MRFSEYLPVILGVLTDFRVIATLIVMLFVIAFSRYVINYQKKPKKSKVKKTVVAAPNPQSESEEGAEGDSEGFDENDGGEND